MMLVVCGRGHSTLPREQKNMPKMQATRTLIRDRILTVLSSADLPMDVENVRVKSGLKNWESTKALLLELLVDGLISGQKTTKSWIFWTNHRPNNYLDERRSQA